MTIWFTPSFHTVTLFCLFCYRKQNKTKQQCELITACVFKYKLLSVSAISHCIVRSPKFRFFLKFNYLVLSYSSLSPIDMSNFILFSCLWCVSP